MQSIIKNEDLKAVFLKSNTTDDEKCILSASLDMDKDSTYQIICSCPIHDYLKAYDCLFLEKESYDERGVETLTYEIEKYQNMPEEERKKMDGVASYVSRAILEIFEIFSNCSTDALADDLSKGLVSREDIYEFGEKEVIFKNAMEDEIKRELLRKNYMSINLEYTTDRALKSVCDKAQLHFMPVSMTFEMTRDAIDIIDTYGDKISREPNEKVLPKINIKS